MLEGGWGDEEEESKDKTNDADDSSENQAAAPTVNKDADDNDMVQSALNSQSVSDSRALQKARNIYSNLNPI